MQPNGEREAEKRPERAPLLPLNQVGFVIGGGHAPLLKVNLINAAKLAAKSGHAGAKKWEDYSVGTG
jgi:hypothetical protein